MIPICVRAGSNGEEEEKGEWVEGGGSGWSVWISVKKDRYAETVREFGTIKTMYACAVEPNDVDPFFVPFSKCISFPPVRDFTCSHENDY